MKVLVVEDQEVAGTALCALLEDDGHEVLLAKSYRAAVVAIESGQCDLALLDVKLPDGDGKELVAAVKASSPGAKVYLATGSALLEQAGEELRFEDSDAMAAKLGADGCLSKPIDFNRLSAILEALD